MTFTWVFGVSDSSRATSDGKNPCCGSSLIRVVCTLFMSSRGERVIKETPNAQKLLAHHRVAPSNARREV